MSSKGKPDAVHVLHASHVDFGDVSGRISEGFRVTVCAMARGETAIISLEASHGIPAGSALAMDHVGARELGMKLIEAAADAKAQALENGAVDE